MQGWPAQGGCAAKSRRSINFLKAKPQVWRPAPNASGSQEPWQRPINKSFRIWPGDQHVIAIATVKTSK